MNDPVLCPSSFAAYVADLPRPVAVTCPSCDQLVELTFKAETNRAYFAGHTPNEPPFWRSLTETRGVGSAREWRGVAKEGGKIAWRGEWTRHEPSAFEAARDVTVAHNLGKDRG